MPTNENLVTLKAIDVLNMVRTDWPPKIIRNIIQRTHSLQILYNHENISQLNSSFSQTDSNNLYQSSKLYPTKNSVVTLVA